MDATNEYGNLQIQQYLLPIMVDIDKFCRENNIKYSLSDGTLLGAVRHKGFIPWDDDIDISLDRENFNKFVEAVKKLENYEIIHDIWIRRVSRIDNPKKHVFPPEGCIDLFVFDKVPESRLKEKLQLFLLKLLQGMIKTNVIYEGFSFKKKMLLFASHVFGKLFPQKLKQRWYDRVSQWGNKKQGTRISRFNGSYKELNQFRFPAEMIDGYCDLPFEGYSFMAMSGWEKFLTTVYGDYMKLPDMNSRKTSHEHVGQKS